MNLRFVLRLERESVVRKFSEFKRPRRKRDVLTYTMGDNVRFSMLIAKIGPPEIYLPLTDPKQDRDFMRAVREHRVLSIKQEPAASGKDFGTIGFMEEKYVSYLIFPKSLRQFEGQRVVGIKYDRLRAAPLATPVPKRSVRPKPKPKPRPKRFTARVRLTSTNEITVVVDALTEKEAREKAEAAARTRRDLSNGIIETKLLDLHADASTAE